MISLPEPKNESRRIDLQPDSRYYHKGNQSLWPAITFEGTQAILPAQCRYVILKAKEGVSNALYFIVLPGDIWIEYVGKMLYLSSSILPASLSNYEIMGEW